MRELTRKAEAVLFAVGRYIALEDIARLLKTDERHAKEALVELMTHYEDNEHTSLVIINDGDNWKLTTKEEFGAIVRRIVSETELTKSQMETLAVIAFKYPIKQSDLIKVRTNKAYDHLKELEAGGFITRQRYGRSKLIKLTDKFFDYFDLPREKLKERFKGFEDLASTIEKKEEEIEQAKEEYEKAAKETEEQEEKDKQAMEGHVELEDEKGREHELEEYAASEEVKTTAGDALEVIDVAPDDDDIAATEDDDSSADEEEDEDETASQVS